MHLQFGDWLVLRRRQAKLTQSDMAKALNVKPQTISAWERNIAVPALNPFQTATLCQMLKVNLEQLSNAFSSDIELND